MMKTNLAFALLMTASALTFPGNSHAAESMGLGGCVRQASETFEIPPVVLAVIAMVEGGASGMESPNSNGSFDLGPLQINTIHLAEFERYGVTRAMLRDDVCVNVAAGAFLLRRHYNSTGDWGAAITRYHSATPKHAARYAGLAVNALKRLSASTAK